MKKLSLIIFIFLNCQIQNLLADEIYLKNGGKLEGSVVEKGDQVEITTISGSKIIISKNDIERIVKKEIKIDDKKGEEKKKQFYGNLYRDAIYRFQIKVPNKWERGKTSKGAIVTFWADRFKEYPSVLDVILLAYNGELEELINTYKESFKKEYPDTKFQNEKSVELKTGSKLVQMEILFTFDKIKLHFLAGFTELRDLKAILLFKSAEKNFLKFKELAKYSMLTFEKCAGEPLPEEDRKSYLENLQKVKEMVSEKKFKEALEIINRMLEKIEDDTEVLKLRALIHSREGNWKEAIQTFEKILEISPDNAEVNYYIGNEYLLNHQYEKAISYFRKAIELNKEYAQAYYGLAVAQDGLGKSLEAINSLKKCIEYDNDYAPAHFSLGNYYVQRKMIKEAIKEFEEVLRIEPDNAQAKARLLEIKK